MILGFYTKKEYKEAISISNMYGYREGVADTKKEAAKHIAAMQIQLDNAKNELKSINTITKLDLMEKIYILESLKKRVKSHKKKKKVQNRIDKELLKVIELQR